MSLLVISCILSSLAFVSTKHKDITSDDTPSNKRINNDKSDTNRQRANVQPTRLQHKINSLNKKIIDIQNTNNECQNQKIIMTQELEKCMTNIGHLNGRIKNCDETNASLISKYTQDVSTTTNEQMKKITVKILELQERENTLKQKLKELQEKYTTLETSKKDELIILERKIESKDNSNKDVQLEYQAELLEVMQREKHKLESQHSTFQQEKSQLTGRISQLINEKAKLSAQHTTTISELESQLNLQKVEFLEREKEITRKKEQIGQLTLEKKRCEQQILNTNQTRKVDEKEINEQHQTEILAFKQELETLKTKIVSITNVNSQTQKQLQDKYDSKMEEMTALTKTVREYGEYKRRSDKQIITNQSALLEKRNAFQTEKSNLTQKVSQLQSKIESLGQSQINIKHESKLIENRYISEKNAIQKNITTLEEKISKLKTDQQLKTEELEERITVLKSSIEQCRKEKIELEQRHNEANTRNQEDITLQLSEQTKRFEKEEKTLQDRIEKILREKTELQNENTSIKQSIQDLKKINSDSHLVNSRLEQQIKNVTDEKELNIESLQGKIQQVQHLEFEKTQQRLKSESETQKLQADIQRLTSTYKEKEARNVLLSTEVGELKIAKEKCEAKITKLKSLESELRTVNAERKKCLDAQKTLTGDMDSLNTKLHALKDQQKNCIARNSRLTGIIGQCKKQIEDLQLKLRDAKQQIHEKQQKRNRGAIRELEQQLESAGQTCISEKQDMRDSHSARVKALQSTNVRLKDKHKQDRLLWMEQSNADAKTTSKHKEAIKLAKQERDDIKKEMKDLISKHEEDMEDAAIMYQEKHDKFRACLQKLRKCERKLEDVGTREDSQRMVDIGASDDSQGMVNIGASDYSQRMVNSDSDDSDDSDDTNNVDNEYKKNEERGRLADEAWALVDFTQSKRANDFNVNEFFNNIDRNIKSSNLTRDELMPIRMFVLNEIKARF